MAFDTHPNLAYSTVVVAPSPASSGTSLHVVPGDGPRFAEYPFNATVWPANTLATPANAEIVRITLQSGDVLTLQRAQEGSAARAIVSGDQIAVTATRKVFEDLESMAFALGPPDVLVDGYVWFEATGTSPSRVLTVNVRDAGNTISIPIATY